MIAADLRFEGFDARSWTNLLSLFAPGALTRLDPGPAAEPGSERSGPAGGEPRGTLVLVVDDEGHAVMAMHTETGRIHHDGPVADPQTLCATYDARRCIVLREGALEELAERVSLRMGADDDYLEQWLGVLRTAREMQEGGHIRVWPRRFSTVPIPNATTVRRAFDLVLPDQRVAVMAIWRRERLWTAAAVRRNRGAIDWVVGAEQIAHWCGAAQQGDLETMSAEVLRAVHKHMGTVHVGLFTDLPTMRRLLRQTEPGGWAVAVAAQEALIQPMPPYVAMALGADVLRALTRSSARLLGSFDLGATFMPIADAVRSQLGRARSLTQTLGFDPLELLARYLRSRNGSAEPEPPRDDGNGDGEPG